MASRTIRKSSIAIIDSKTRGKGPQMQKKPGLDTIGVSGPGFFRWIQLVAG